jgi:pseudouridine synthase
MNGRVRLNDKLAGIGIQVESDDQVFLDGKLLILPADSLTLILNKPAGYICSRQGQGATTIYELLPERYKDLQTAGRLDKASSGLLVMSNDGDLVHRLTHPRFIKNKVYVISVDRALAKKDMETITQQGVELTDGISRLELSKIDSTKKNWKVTMHEGRNRQIRRTFMALGYDVNQLHRIAMGPYLLEGLKSGQYKLI